MKRDLNDLEVRLLERWQAAGHPEAVGLDLLAKYAETHRHYHTADHLSSLFNLLDSDEEARRAAARLSNIDRQALELAIWYHDREYDPRKADNEVLSALQFLGDAARLQVDGEVRTRVVALILLSQTHRPAAADVLGGLFCDLDLSILAEPRTTYERYAGNVRAEYRHVPDALFYKGRGRVLLGFATRPVLFRYLQRREGAARANLAWEMERCRLRPGGFYGPAPRAWVWLGCLACLGASQSALLVGLALLGLVGWATWQRRDTRRRLLDNIRYGGVLFPDQPGRRQLWHLLSELYLDTEVDVELLAGRIRSLGYSAAEVRVAVGYEVGPILWPNLLSVAGEWAGFDPDWLQTRILQRRYALPSPWVLRWQAAFTTWLVLDALQPVLDALR